MSHNIEINENNKASMAYVGELPWHGLGTKLPSDVTPQQMMKAAGLDWSVEKAPLMASLDDGSLINIDKKEALVRSTDKKVLSIVGKNWNPVQNEEAFEFFNQFVLEGDMDMHTAGSLNGGRNVWALAKVKAGFSINGGDEVESFLLFSNPHKFGASINVRFTPIRVVCNNTLTMSLSRNANKGMTMTHRAKFDPSKVNEALGIVTDKLQSYKEAAQFLSSKRYNAENLEEYFTKVFPMTNGNSGVSRAAKRLEELVETQPGHDFASGSFWNLFNAVTYYADHEQGRSNDARLSSAWFGIGATQKNKAFKLAIDMADAA